MAYAALPAARLAAACERHLAALRPEGSSPEAFERRRTMVTRIMLLARAAAETDAPLTLTSEEFSLVAAEW